MPPAKRSARSYWATASRWAPSTARAPCGLWRVLEHGRRIAGELGVVGAHRGVDPAGIEQSAEDRVMQTRSPRRRDRGVDDLPGELVSEA